MIPKIVANRTLPVGAEISAEAGVHFRVWAPLRKQVQVVLESGPGAPAEIELAADGGYFVGVAEHAAAGTRYRYRLDGAGVFPDPASRFQADGPHGSSEVIDPTRFPWTDSDWAGLTIDGQVICEVHIGTFTESGTWDGAIEQLSILAEMGISAIELMPVADFPGRFGWGYDGVDLFAPTWLYGRPDDFRRFVNAAHTHGIGVILDVVYNHFGPDGNYWGEFSPYYFTDAYTNEWGEAINFDGENSGPVREFFASNAAYWIREFHIDGLRLDATQQMFDTSPENIIAVIGQRAREAAGARSILLIAENEPQQTGLVRPLEAGGLGLDALWNDDFHHSAMVSMTGRNEAYYSDYLGKPQEFISAVKYGYLYQGQWYKWQNKRRGTPSFGVRSPQFVNYIQNHDQIANSSRGERVHKLTSPGRYKAMTALLLLAPNTPMLFQGQEFASSRPFAYFADHKPELAKLVQDGRARFLSQFRSLAVPDSQQSLLDPGNPATFQKCKLDFAERERHTGYCALHRDLIRLRREDCVFRSQGAGGLDGAVLGNEAFVLRYFGEGGDDRLLIVNLGIDLHLNPAPEPLLAPPERMRWSVLWSSEDTRYGGYGAYCPDTASDNWLLPGHAAVVLRPTLADENSNA